jgi:sugar-specific transcriptional regulator TrmB
MEKDILRKIGLSETESKIYLSLLTLGSALAGEITKHSGVNRTNVYDALDRLIEKGLTSFIIKDGKKIFESTPPHRLKELLKEKEEMLDNIMDKLEKKYNESKPKEKAIIYYGKKGVKTVMEEILKEGKTMYAYGGQSLFTEMFPIYQRQWNKKRGILGIKLKMLFSEKVKAEKKSKNFSLATFKFLPKEYNFPSIVSIFGDNVATIIWKEKPIVILIKSKDAAETYMNFFDMLWKIAKR